MRRVPRRILTLAVAVVSLLTGAVVVHAGGADDLRDRASELENQLGSLETSEEASVLELFSLESKLGLAARRVDTLATQADQVEKATTAAREATQVARRSVSVAESNLAERVRALYMTSDIDSIEVLLGARSVQDAIDGIGALRRTVRYDDALLTQVSRARTTAIERRDDLRRRQERAEELVTDARAARVSLEQTRADRRRFLQELRAELNLGRRDVVALRERATEVEARAAQLQAEAAARATPVASESAASTSPAQPPESDRVSDPPTPEPAPTPPSGSPPPPAPSPSPSPPAVDLTGGSGPRAGSQMTVVATGYALTGTTAVGLQTQYGIIAVDPNVIPLGTKMSVPGYGEGVAADTGSAVQGAIIDLWFPSVDEARAWGRRTVTITFR